MTSKMKQKTRSKAKFITDSSKMW